MPLGMEFSMVADSTISSSPQAVVDVESLVKRAPRTYGRRRDERQEDPDSSISYTEAPSSLSRGNVHNTAPPDLLDEVPPTSPPDHLIDSDASRQDTDQESPRFEFDWKKRMKEMDEENDDDNELSNVATLDAAPNPTSFGQPALLQGTTDSVVQPNATSDLRDSNLPPAFEDVFGTNSSSGTGESPPFARPSFNLSSPKSIVSRVHTRIGNVVHGSDSEEEPAKNSSLATTPSSSKLFKSRSSSTQPTSEDDMPPDISSKPRFTGKQKTSSALRSSVKPLVFTEESTGDMKKLTSKNKKNKIKAPSKKDIQEMDKERTRLAVANPVSIARSGRSKYNKESLLAKIMQDSRQALPAMIPKVSIPTSDPILPFSSPTKPDHDVGPSHSILRQETPLANGIPDDRDSDEDSDLPNIEQVLTEDILTATKRKDLFEMKKRALERQLKHSVPSDDDDDGLEIVLSRPNIVVNEEEEHRCSAKKRPSEGRKRQLHFAKVSTAKQAMSPVRKAQADISSLTLRQTAETGTLDQRRLNLILTSAAQVRARELTKMKEEEWKKHGGRVCVTAVGQTEELATIINAIAAKGLTAPKSKDDDTDVNDGENVSDEDWNPDMRGSVSPEPTDEQEEGEGRDSDEDRENNGYTSADEDITMADDEDTQGEDLNVRAPRKRVAVVVSSDSENEGENDENLPIPSTSQEIYHRASSSCDTEDDKENDTKLMYDRSEDKENTAVVRHGALTLSPFSLLNSEGVSSAPVSPVVAAWSSDSRTTTLNEGRSAERREPFKNLISEETAISTPSFTAMLQQVSPPPMALTPEPTLTTFFDVGKSGIKRSPGGFSQFDRNTEFSAVPCLQPGFSDLFESPLKQKSPTGLNKKVVSELRKFNTDTLELTQDVSNTVLQPAFEGRDGFFRKADGILEKEDAFVVEDAHSSRQPGKKPVLYVNDHGFLTQTRPNDESPEVYRPSPSQTFYGGNLREPLLSISPSQTQTQHRVPLRTLSISTPSPPNSPQIQHRRLRKRSITSPLFGDHQLGSSTFSKPPQKPNAFEMLERGAQKIKQRKELRMRPDMAEFFENEAAESDEDNTFGFIKPTGEDDEEDGEDLDKVLEGLVDDQEMDEKTVAEKLVQEKFREQLEAQDQEVEKFHQGLIQGELRQKRRRGVGVDDSGDESDAEDNERARQRRKKFRKSRGDIDNLEANEETRAFAETYNSTLRDEDDEFSYLNQESQFPDILSGSTVVDEEYEDENEDKENDQENHSDTITRQEFVRQIRALKEQDKTEDDVPMDPTDVSWVDRDDEEAPRVKTVIARRRRGQLQTAEPSETDGMGAAFRETANSMSLSSKQWYAQENKTRNGGTSRSVGGSAITGHAKAKPRTGSVGVGKGALAAKSASVSSSVSRSGTKVMKAGPSMLSVLSDKSGLFG